MAPRICVLASIIQTATSSTLSLVQKHAALRAPTAHASTKYAPASCVVWHSQHKSAGRDIENLIGFIPFKGTGLDKQEWQGSAECKFRCDRENWDCENKTCRIGAHGYEYECNRPIDNRVAMSGYVPRLSGSADWGHAGGGPCVWATMSREPVSRLISALFYCRHGWDNDPLCGKWRLLAKDATIQSWAQHWGNFLFRELMWHPQLHTIASSRSDFKNHTCSDQDPWVQFKDQLNGGDDLSTESGRLNFEAVKDALRYESRKPLYDVWGVVEMWNLTMAAFDERFPFEGLTWFQATVHGHANHGSDHWKDEEKKALEEARKDPVVLKALEADIYLYNKLIVPNFNRYAEEHDLASAVADYRDAWTHRALFGFDRYVKMRDLERLATPSQ